ncbi:MAG: DUF1080 domain-containing protein [Planctomycetota bacterium]
MLGTTKLFGAAALGAACVLGLQEDELGYQDTPLLPQSRWHVHDGLRPQPPVVTPGATDAAPPSDATVLFDGSSLDAFDGGPWALEDGIMTVNGSGGIQTKESFGACQLHLEWRAPIYDGAGPTGQGRGNSGVFFFGRYEVQILDCFENRTYPDGMTAALYGQQPPMANACRPAGAWQSYDIMFQPPVFANGRAVRGAFVTVLHNGVCVHHAQLSLGATQHRKVASYAPHAETGPISIQDHGNPISFRNIWVRPLSPAQ